MGRPRLSIVTPSFNQGQFLEETISSVFDQDYENLEYIVMDGGSTDRSIEIIKKYSDRLTLGHVRTRHIAFDEINIANNNLISVGHTQVLYVQNNIFQFVLHR